MFPTSSSASQNTETRLALLEEKMEIYETMIKRIESAIEKISESGTSVSKMLAVHNERLEQCSRLDDSIMQSIEKVRVEGKSQHEELEERLSTRLEKVEEKVDEISRIKWMTVGCGVLLAILTAAMSSLASGWWTPSEMQMQRQGHAHQQNVNESNFAN